MSASLSVSRNFYKKNHAIFSQCTLYQGEEKFNEVITYRRNEYSDEALRPRRYRRSLKCDEEGNIHYFGKKNDTHYRHYTASLAHSTEGYLMQLTTYLSLRGASCTRYARRAHDTHKCICKKNHIRLHSISSYH